MNNQVINSYHLQEVQIGNDSNERGSRVHIKYAEAANPQLPILVKEMLKKTYRNSH